jgi:ApaG protein
MRDESMAEGIRVRVRPAFSLARSDPSAGTWVFSYRVELENEGTDPARLLFRHWLIHDSAGEDMEVDGEGVVGEQPLLHPGDLHAYSSFCVLQSPIGYMEGYYTFVRSDGERFRVPVPRFALEAPFSPGAPDDDEQPRQMN